jgi:hypothetical protein
MPCAIGCKQRPRKIEDGKRKSELVRRVSDWSSDELKIICYERLSRLAFLHIWCR